MKKILIILIALSAGYYFYDNRQVPGLTGDVATEPAASESNEAIAAAFTDHKSNLQVAGSGVVKKLLPQDNHGSRHQKFIIEMASGQTLLVAHNIDLAAGIDSLRQGDAVQFFGEYEWTPQGGVIHWTHRDPKGQHVAGWLKHQGQIYQ